MLQRIVPSRLFGRIRSCPRAAGLLLGALAAACSGSEFGTSKSGQSASGGGSGSGGTTADAMSTSGGGQLGSGGGSSGGSGATLGSGGVGATEGGRQSGGAGSSSGGALTVDAGGAANGGTGAVASGGTGTGHADAGGCANPATWYRDSDGDGYGTDSVKIISCSSPAPTGWTTQGGDCMDDKRDVNPGQTTYFDTPYSVGNGNNSFDWDCSGTEDGDPTQKTGGKCGLFQSCDASTGYTQTARTGTNLNPFCGSQSYLTCTGVIGLCSASTKDLGTGSGYRCR
jgi:hypothetical protein